MQSGYDFELDPVSFITIGTIGPPGERTFFLQAAKGEQVVSVVIEKEHASALAASVKRLLMALAEAYPEELRDLEAKSGAMELRQPVEPVFRASELGIGVEEHRHLIVLVAHERVSDEPGQRARFFGTYAQMLALAQQALEVVERGRPTCELCGEPIDPEGHVCPRGNGHHRPVET